MIRVPAEVNVCDNSKYPADKYTMKAGRQESMGTLILLIPTTNKTTDITYEYRVLGSVGAFAMKMANSI